jgi:hypothetical protein
VKELGVTDPVPPLKAPPVSDQLQQGFRGRAQAGENELPGPEWLAVAMSCGDKINGLADSLDRQEDVSPLLLQLPKNGFWVDKASAPISSPFQGQRDYAWVAYITDLVFPASIAHNDLT